MLPQAVLWQHVAVTAIPHADFDHGPPDRRWTAAGLQASGLAKGRKSLHSRLFYCL